MPSVSGSIFTAGAVGPKSSMSTDSVFQRASTVTVDARVSRRSMPSTTAGPRRGLGGQEGGDEEEGHEGGNTGAHGPATSTYAVKVSRAGFLVRAGDGLV